MHSFHATLVPFAENAPPTEITASIVSVKNLLTVSFSLSGNLAMLAIPSFASTTAQRRDNIWTHTCFEIFISPQHREDYWEVNIAPSGDWNFYHFQEYRTGMRREEAFQSLPVHASWTQNTFHIATTIDLQKICTAPNILGTGIASVLAEKNGALSYWAVKHAPDRPDFHRKENFCFDLHYDREQ